MSMPLECESSAELISYYGVRARELCSRGQQVEAAERERERERSFIDNQEVTEATKGDLSLVLTIEFPVQTDELLSGPSAMKINTRHMLVVAPTMPAVLLA
jgi:hypothetical protein